MKKLVLVALVFHPLQAMDEWQPGEWLHVDKFSQADYVDTLSKIDTELQWLENMLAQNYNGPKRAQIDSLIQQS